jgi:hypothetical protein
MKKIKSLLEFQLERSRLLDEAKRIISDYRNRAEGCILVGNPKELWQPVVDQCNNWLERKKKNAVTEIRD